MFNWLRQFKRRRILKKSPMSDTLWQRTVSSVPLARSLDPVSKLRLRDLTTLFLDQKDFYGGDGFEVDENRAARIAAQACVPALSLGFDALEGWYSIYVYPGQFRTRRQYRNQHGLVDEDHRVLAGEAQHRGGIVLSWEDVEEDIRYGNDGSNVVIHEIAHKLDMLNGDADGYPPLHPGMNQSVWAQVMRSAYEAMNARLAAHQPTVIDAYAASHPAEFFAVCSEVFFEAPAVLRREFEAVYEQFVLFYRWDPAV